MSTIFSNFRLTANNNHYYPVRAYHMPGYTQHLTCTPHLLSQQSLKVDTINIPHLWLSKLRNIEVQ